MGSELSACCVSSPLPMGRSSQDEILDIETVITDTHEEDLSHLVYYLVSEDKYDVLQQVINDNNLDIASVQWKNSLNPLHISAMRGHLMTTQMLIINGLNPNFVDKLGRTPLHWAARNRHWEVFEFLKPLTSEPSRRDIYGISATSFYSKDHLIHDGLPGHQSPPMSPLSPLSISSLTLHTISLATNESSPIESHVLSPRVMAVSLSPQKYISKISPLRPFDSPMESSSESPFLIEEKSELSTASFTEGEWEPLDERFQVDTFNLAKITIDTNFDPSHNSPRPLEHVRRIDPLGGCSFESQSMNSSKEQSNKFYSLQRKISLMLFNHDEKYSTKEDSKVFGRVASSEQHHLMISHSSSYNPLNGLAESERTQEDYQNESCENLTDMMTPISQSTTISTNSDDRSTKLNWINWKNIDLKWKGIKKHSRSLSTHSDEDSAELSTIRPFYSVLSSK